MAIMVTAMEKSKSILLLLLLLFLLFSSNNIFAGKWNFIPSVEITETYTDNVKLSPINKQDSFISQTSTTLNTNYSSRQIEFTLSGKINYLAYSHNNQLNNDYRSLNATGKYSLWADGPRLVFTANIANVSKNGANNSLADLASADTVEVQTYSAGLEHVLANSAYNVTSSIYFQYSTSGDNIGDNEGYTATLVSENGHSARTVFWQLNSNFVKKQLNSSQTILRSQSTATPDAEKYIIEGIVGAITPYNFNPFIRYYDEDINGISSTNNNTLTSSWGPGVRWLATKHLFLDLSYNYVKDNSVSDNYFAAKIGWQPSSRTTLNTSYSKRFFGDSYNVDFQHKTKRLTNSIAYNETLQAFDRNNYNRVNLGAFWCPSADYSGETYQCFVNNVPSIDYQLVTLSTLELEQSKGFSLKKTLSWSSILQLTKTNFSFIASRIERKELNTGRVNDIQNMKLSVSRRISAKSDVELTGSFRHQQLDQENDQTSQQNDYYRTATIKYTRKLASSLSGDISTQYLNRSSNEDRFSYQELRAIITIKKEF